MGPMTTPDIFFEYVLATILGVISPNIKTTTVIDTVATATAFPDLDPIICKVTMVAIDEAKIFTILFPKSIAVKISLGLVNHFFNNFAVLGLVFSISSRSVLLNAVRAVSEAENNPDKIINTTNKIN